MYEQMDKGDVVDALFFNGDKLSKEGKEFLEKIKNYGNDIKQIILSNLTLSIWLKIFTILLISAEYIFILFWLNWILIS